MKNKVCLNHNNIKLIATKFCLYKVIFTFQSKMPTWGNITHLQEWWKLKKRLTMLSRVTKEHSYTKAMELCTFMRINEWTLLQSMNDIDKS